MPWNYLLNSTSEIIFKVVSHWWGSCGENYTSGSLECFSWENQDSGRCPAQLSEQFLSIGPIFFLHCLPPKHVFWPRHRVGGFTFCWFTWKMWIKSFVWCPGISWSLLERRSQENCGLASRGFRITLMPKKYETELYQIPGMRNGVLMDAGYSSYYHTCAFWESVSFSCRSGLSSSPDRI